MSIYYSKCEDPAWGLTKNVFLYSTPLNSVTYLLKLQGTNTMVAHGVSSTRSVLSPIRQSISYPHRDDCTINFGGFTVLNLPFIVRGEPLVISHKCRLISWLILAIRPPMHFLHKTFPGVSDKISHCAKLHSSSCLIYWLPKSDLCETTECSPPLQIIGS